VNIDVPGSNLKGVISGYEFLENVFSGGLENYLRKPKYDLGNDILVIGGGDTSLDCARTALRLTKGESNVTVLCLHPKTEFMLTQ
jgi:glutamate synthase (NADPH/NADH) small chain